jgi:hypothetical protein
VSETPAAFAERQIVTTLVASRHARGYLEGSVTAEDFGSIRYRRLFAAGMARQVIEWQEERVAALAAAVPDFIEDELWQLLDADDRLCFIDSSRFARQVADFAKRRAISAKIADLHGRITGGETADAVLAELKGMVA